MQDVDKKGGCLSLISLKDTKRKLFHPKEYNFRETGYLGLKKKDILKFRNHPISMKKGDVLCFNHLTPHGTNPLKKNYVRWSLDIRYECTKKATGIGKKYGFVANSKNKKNITKISDWLKRKQI